MADTAPALAAAGPIGFFQALRRLFRLLSTARRRQFFRVFGLMLLGALAEVILVASAVPFLALLGGSLDSAALGPVGDIVEVADLEPASVAPLFMIAVLVASGIRLLLSWANHNFVVGVGHDLAVETQRRILLQPYSFHIERSTSESIGALHKIQVLVFGVLQQTMTNIVAVLMGLFIMSLLISVDPIAALSAFVVFGLFYWVVSRLTAARLARNSEVVGSAYDQRVKMIQESLGGIRDLIIDQTQPVYLEEFRKVDQRFARAEAATIFIAGSPRFLLEGAALIFVAALAMMLADRDGGASRALPVIGAIALGGLRLMPLMQQAFASWATLAANRSVVGQVLDLLSLPLPDRPDSETRLLFCNSIRLDDVSYTYPKRADPAVDRTDLEIRCGERIALVGETGSGKSTLADLIMGLLPPQSGGIEVDGVPLNLANVGAWQRNIAHVSQSIFLADASIARNIAFSVAAEGLDMDRVRRAAAHAEIAEFIETLADGYDTDVGERGVRLSGGQRQRIAIARALYKDAPLLVLDEATSALDRETEAKVIANILADESRTVVIITHRPSAIEACGRVLTLSHGKVLPAS